MERELGVLTCFEGKTNFNWGKPLRFFKDLDIKTGPFRGLKLMNAGRSWMVSGLDMDRIGSVCSVARRMG